MQPHPKSKKLENDDDFDEVRKLLTQKALKDLHGGNEGEISRGSKLRSLYFERKGDIDLMCGPYAVIQKPKETLWQHLERLDEYEGNQLTAQNHEDEKISFAIPLAGNKYKMISVTSSETVTVEDIILNDLNVIVPVYIEVCCLKPKLIGESLLEKRKREQNK